MVQVSDLQHYGDELLSTTRSIRRRLDLERPVDLSVIQECISIACQAPSGSNRQGWRWVVVTDEEKRSALGDLYRRGGADYVRERLDSATDDGERRVFESAQHLIDVIDHVPVLVVPCIYGRTRDLDDAGLAGLYGSILPAVWSFMLALRSRGLGSAWTTFHLHDADAAAKILSIPKEFTQVALLPVAHTIGSSFKEAQRKDVHDILYFDTWGATSGNA